MVLGFILNLFKSEKAAVLILAGGKSLRMGRDKRFLMYKNEPFVLHTFNAARNVSKDIYMLISSEEDKHVLQKMVGNVPFMLDQYPGFGPLPALMDALPEVPRDYALLLSVDYPLMTGKFLTNMKKYLDKEDPKPDVLVPLFQDIPQVTCAFYRKSVIESLEQAYEWGELSLQRWIENFDGYVAYIEEEVWRQWDSTDALLNVNTPTDYEQITSRDPIALKGSKIF